MEYTPKNMQSVIMKNNVGIWEPIVNGTMGLPSIAMILRFVQSKG